ncbi:uncharacterized protein si:dkey-106l3.7 isoform X2 [Danio rerio]|uniref:Uncharacterized protein si:dkey-106l3.7 isoform X2 n=1 Tax=Danio rerio TaxID=7955 RepID=A0A8M3B639_DANRE|nr:uncharacterized protein si:dkey-106l3.7 isoform X2 [Danio rerio]|eukprot:XP_009303495.1 uncharacterized protein si:dkey-106l3.7 isoform X2 [Danio rerio]
MNLYRSFGNIFENLVAKGYSDSSFHSPAGLDRTDSVSRESVPLSNVKSESEDSGVETISTTSPCHSHQCSGLTSEEIHPVFDSTEDPPSPSPSICSSSSSNVSLGTVAQKTTCLEVEQALRRAEPSCREKSWTTGLWYESNTTSFSTSCHLIGSRTENHRFAHPRRTHSQPPDPQKAELYRKHLKLRHHGYPVDRQLADGGDQARLDALSPGLLYLEQVCRMLENIAKLQQQNQSLQSELEVLRSQQAQIQCVSSHEEEISCPAFQHLDILSHESPASQSTLLKEPGGFRHRSASDTQTINRHRRTRFVRDEQIADALVEEPEDKDPLPEIKHKNQSRIQKLKFTSFRKKQTHQSDAESNSLQTKKKTKLQNMFRRRMTTRL